MSYEELNWYASDDHWIARVKAALTHTAANVKIKAAPSGNQEIADDALGRSILADQDGWARRFSLVVGLGFLGNATLAEVSDAAIFSRIDAVFDSFLTTPVV